MGGERAGNPLDTLPRLEFWQDGLAAMARHACDLLLLAGEPVNHRTILAVVRGAPTHLRCVDDAYWQRTSYCYHCLVKAHERFGGKNGRLAEISTYFFRYF